MAEKKEKTFVEKLVEIQSKLKAPKSQTNAFGKYQYRSCEDILTAVKPLLKEHSLYLTISDEIISIDNRFYVKATAAIASGKRTVDGRFETLDVDGFAREALEKKGMDVSQITGAASSYARKYALNGLFCIDDTKDSDFTNNGTQGKQEPAKEQKPQSSPTSASNKPSVEDDEIRDRIVTMLKKIFEIKSDDDIRDKIEVYSGFQGDKGFVKGKRSTFDLSGKWLRNTYAKIKKDHETWKSEFGEGQAEYVKEDE